MFIHKDTVSHDSIVVFSVLMRQFGEKKNVVWVLQGLVHDQHQNCGLFSENQGLRDCQKPKTIENDRVVRVGKRRCFTCFPLVLTLRQAR